MVRPASIQDTDVPDRRKNILLISFDDAFAFWRYRSVFGAELQIPNIDRICAQATVFHDAYCQSPLCGPSRASFLSGRTPPQSGIYSNKEKFYDRIDVETLWSFQLKKSGYFCSSGGKVHHGFRPLRKSVHRQLYSDERKTFSVDLGLPEDVAQRSTGGSGGGISSTDPEQDQTYYDYKSARSCAKFLKTYDGDEPFYREVGFFSPHSPFITPDRFKDMYPFKLFHYPPSWADGFERSAHSDKIITPNFKTRVQRHWRKSVRNYFSAVSHGDHHLGTVWDALQKSKHADNTIVVILSDHGHHLGENGRFGKSTLLEQAALVPLIIYDPDDRTARTVTSPVALLDVGPTILDYAELPLQAFCKGVSLRGAVHGGRLDPDRSVPTFNPNGSSIRKGKYRLIRYNEGTTEMYDLQNDWWQQRNLGPEHPDFAGMEAAHRACCAAHGLDLQQMPQVC
jgi:arylsulfatase A-like enzyme